MWKNCQIQSFSINFSKVEVLATLSKVWFYDHHTSIKGNLHTNKPYLDKKLNDSVELNKGYMLRGAATAKELEIMIICFYFNMVAKSLSDILNNSI